MRASLDLSESENVEDALRMSDMFAAIDQAPQAVVARVHGAALGGGMGLIAVCDIVVAASDSRFGFTEAKLGIVPAVISRFVFPKVGPSWSRALFLTGERFDVNLARTMGLVHHSASAEELDAEVGRVVDELMSAGPGAVRAAKTLVAGLQSKPYEEHRRYTAETIARLRAGTEGQEGLRAFLEKRKPSWRRD